MMTLQIFKLLPRLGALALAALLSWPVLAQQNYPNRAITLMVPFGPGGTSDIMARILERRMSPELGVSMVVDNKAGAGGAIGMSQLMRAAPDGYTIGLAVIGPEVLQPAIRDTGYTHADFDHICGTYDVPLMMMTTQDSPFQSLADVVDYARKNPGQLTYGTSGTGTLLHLVMESLLQSVNATALHVPYKGSSEIVTALLGKHIMVFNDTPTISKQYNLKPLAVFASQRMAAYPDVPTAAESGHPLEGTVWGGLIAPKGLPQTALQTLEAACQRAVQSESYRADAQRLDTPAVFRNAADFAAFVQAQAQRYGKVVVRQ